MTIFGVSSTGPELGKEELVGIIKMVADRSNHNGVEGYAECEMTMHPNYRGKGIGPLFRMQFHDQIIVPILQTARKFVDNLTVFQGTIGYVHAYNAPSRRMMTKLGFVPVRLTTKPYFEGQEALQIMYIFPPLPPDYNLPAPLSADLVQVIQNNDLVENPTIPVRYLNQEPIIVVCLEEAKKNRQKSLDEGIPIRFVPSLSKFFSKILEDFMPSFLEKASGQPLLQRAQEIALLENIQQVAEKNGLLDEEILTFLQKQDIENKRHIFQEMMTSS
ncbi:MAG: GNAT family N-acetyltransferase [Pseudomonadota bacterium]|jgi:GNAT superfamily N-acetyltransferase